jgi:hypothetical protein
VAGYRLIVHRRSEDMREELKIIDINSRIKDYQIKWRQHLEIMKKKKTEFLNYN